MKIIVYLKLFFFCLPFFLFTGYSSPIHRPKLPRAILKKRQGLLVSSFQARWRYSACTSVILLHRRDDRHLHDVAAVQFQFAFIYSLETKQ